MPAKDCSELARTITDLAMTIAAQPGVDNLDAVVAEMEKTVEGIDRDYVVEAINEATVGEAKQQDALSKKLNEIRSEARGDAALKRKIGKLTRTLEAGETLNPQKRVDRASQAIKDLRDIRDDLKKKIAKSEPTQKKRLEAQIDALTRNLNIFTQTGDPTSILPKQKVPDVPKTKNLERLQFKRDKIRREIQRRIQGLKPRSAFEKFFQEPFNVARGLMTSFDFSGVGRQGGFLAVAHPIRASRALGPMFRAFASEQAQAKIEKEIQDRPNAPLYRKAKLFIAPVDGTHKLSEREEIMQARLLDKIPGVAASNRAYATFLNKLRADSFDAMVAGLSKNGEATLEEATAIADYVNTASGRGSLGKAGSLGEKAAGLLNTVFFAPRYVASRFQLLAGKPFFGGNSRTRKAIAKEYVRYLIGMGVVYGLAGLSKDDEDFEWDPRSSDFGKIRFGNTRLDPLSGLSQPTVLLSRLINGKVKSSTIGRISPIRGEDVGFGRRSSAGVLGSFFRYKLSPMFGTALNLITGEDAIGRPFSPKDLPKNLLIPLSMKEITETMREQGVPRGTALSLLSIFGMGIQTYGSQTTKKRKSVSSGRAKRPKSSGRATRSSTSRGGR